MKKICLLFFSLCVTLVLLAQVTIIPRPNSVEPGEGSFTLTASTGIYNKTKATQKSADFLNAYLSKFYDLKLNNVKSGTGNKIVLEIADNSGDTSGSYKLEVSPQQVTITGADDKGVFYGVQTLIQLLPTTPSASLSISSVAVTDAPRFGYRGMMLDCGRHFFDVDFVKKYIDFLALHKFNTFHWHLTDDQGWRIEIKKFPRLSEIGGCRNGTITGHYPGDGNTDKKECGFYTQKQVKEIVKYAADRYITVIPEIEMPGHASAAIAAYPKLSCFPDEATMPGKGVKDWAGPQTGKQVQQGWGVYPDVFCPSDYTFNFLENVLDEVMTLFPSKYIHIGGDECPKDNWKRSEFCQNLIKEKGLKDEHGLQSYFIQRIEKYLNSKGRNIIGWDEILEGGLAPNATVMSWRGEKGGIEAAEQNHDVIMTPTTYVYFDYAQTKNEDSLVIGGFLPLSKVYNYNPLPSELSNDKHKFILGAQANVWTEYMDNPGKVEYQIFPRMTALSEVLWTDPADKDLDDFKRRLAEQYKRYELWHASYSKAQD